MQRKFVRDGESVPVTNFYGGFREWIGINFPTLNDVTWSQLLEEDRNIDYSMTGSGMTCEEVIDDGIAPETNSDE